ncbi:MAG: sugar phosphate isomerase/epimerase family protein [Casimicrobiaceae bacterium]
MQLGGTNFGYLNTHSLNDSLEHLASCGIEVVELGLAAPHFDLATASDRDVSALRGSLDRLYLRCHSVNAAELNLISQNTGVAGVAMQQYSRLIRIAPALGANTVVVVPGRQHPLRPIPMQLAVDGFLARLRLLLNEAERNDVVLALETVPFGFLQTAREIADLIATIRHPLLSMALDCANMFMVEDPAAGVHAAPERIAVCHVSDAWKTRWAHTSIGLGEVDFGAFKRALDAVDYPGVTIYELMDAQDPVPRLAGDIARLESLGWKRRPIDS